MAGLTATEGAYLTSCFWGTFAIGRLVSIGVATKLSPAFMIMFNIVSRIDCSRRARDTFVVLSMLMRVIPCAAEW